MNRKERQVERYLRQEKHLRTREEEKALQREARERKSRRKRERPRPKDWDPEDEDVPLRESIRRPGKSASQRPPSTPVTSTAAGTVLSVLRGVVLVQVEGDERRVRLGPEFHGRPSPVVHDQVELVERGGEFFVQAIHPRRTVLARPVPGHENRDRVFAANIDVALLVVSWREPDFRARLLDRALVLARRGGVEPCLVVSKLDLLRGAAEREKLEGVLRVYRDLGLGVHGVSTVTGQGLEPLVESLRGRAVVLFGQSGVGKSSLVNALARGVDEEPAQVGRVRRGDGKGRHTTTVSRVHDLGHGTRLIDTPGVRALGLAPVDRDHLLEAFPEFADWSCRFSDCSHGSEPGCGVRRAVDQGALAPERFDAYRRLLRSLDEHDRGSGEVISDEP